MTAIDVAIIAAFVVYTFACGFTNRKIASQNLEEYFLAGRTLRGWLAGISMAATQFAADTPLLVTGLIATGGVFSLWRLWIYAVSFLLMGFVLAPSWRKAHVLTDAELTELRYGSSAAEWLRGIKAIYFGTIFNCVGLAMVLMAATRIAEPFLFWNEWLPPQLFAVIQSAVEALGVPLISTDIHTQDIWVRSTNNLLSIGAIILVTTFYSTTGGLRSVVGTDFLQFGIAMLATVVFAWIVIDRCGGLNGIHDGLVARYGAEQTSRLLAFTPTEANDATSAVLLMYSLQWLVQLNSDGTGYLAQRSMACRSDYDSKLAAVVFTVAQVLFRSLVWLPLGLGLLVLYPPALPQGAAGFAAEREFTFVRGIAELLPPGIKGFMLVGMFAALASTLDTHLNWGASYWANDIYKRFICQAWLKREPGPRSLVWVARGATLLILFISLSIIPLLSSIQTAWRMSLLLGAGMGVILVLRWIWWRINAWGEVATIAASVIVAPILIWSVPSGSDSDEATRLLLIATVATTAGVTASLWTRPESTERLREFYRRARPPGFWGPVATATGETAQAPRARLKRGLTATFLAAFSIFCLLTGLGSWIAGSPAPALFPWPVAWISLTITLGAALFPISIKIAFTDPTLYPYRPKT